MYFILNEAGLNDRFGGTGNVWFYSSMRLLLEDTEPQDFEYGEFHIADTDGFDYSISYNSKTNSVKILKASNCLPQVREMVKKTLYEKHSVFDDDFTISENLLHAERDGKLTIHR